MQTTTRENPAQLKVIGLGLGRTGTLSLYTALEKLGFGPCHHPIIFGGGDRCFSKLARALRGDASPEALDDIFRGYGAAMDATTATLAEPLYKAYPDAKFILTIRDRTKWVESMRKTIFKSIIESDERASRITSGTASEDDRMLFEKTKESGSMDWLNEYLKGYHQGRLMTDPEGEFDRHNRFITELIPAEKLLIFDVSEGWGPLVKFLGVPEPNEPFPDSNNLTEYKENKNAWREKLLQA